jgi:hypothetical protein
MAFIDTITTIPYIILKTDSGKIESRFDLFGINDDYIKHYGYEVLHRGNVSNYKEYDKVLKIVHDANIDGNIDLEKL